MATANDCNMSIALILSTSALGFTLQHAWKFDRCRCLFPKRKEWFRVLLTWMLIGSTMMIIAWSAGWTIIKYDVGWTTIPPYGAMPYPPVLYEKKYVDLNLPYTIIFNLAFSIQASLNAEEGLYWYHLIRAVRQPKSSRSWLTSSFFYAWIIISVVCTACQSGLGWIHSGKLDLDVQMARIMTVHGCIEFAVVLSSSVVIWKFPDFLADVKASGAGPDVRSRLHFYHGKLAMKANKIRNFFRFLFATCMMILGIDGLTDSQTIHFNNLASDLLTHIIFGSFFFVLITSTLLYLPRSWVADDQRSHQVMVGDPNAQMRVGESNNIASGIALMSLLREGGQWDNDDDLRENNRLSRVNEDTNNGAFSNLEVPVPVVADEWRNNLNDLKKKGSWDSEGSELGMPMALDNFTSPIAVHTDESVSPTEIRIRIEQEVTRDHDII
uniref:Uncharacterized protein n=1 Tax=Kwoniella bestiolae CBS 10118 TaxID=1296100 RepID=A0A1B9FZU6_9TREE|nr:hypothetical protein I302_05748 [Kwoniella bestiolae CBS 10118]OCF24289.1 hypothetical protein I302_05748 [Kwoniella bestiolae CBS 10118]